MFFCVREHLSHLQSQRDACQQILNEIKAALDFLEEVQEKYKSVSRKTSGLHEACENLIAEQVCACPIADCDFFAVSEIILGEN